MKKTLMRIVPAQPVFFLPCRTSSSVQQNCDENDHRNDEYTSTHSADENQVILVKAGSRADL